MSQQEEPLEGIPVLGYSGGGYGAGDTGQRPAFNARRRWMWSGEHLFRIYLTPEFVYFIRIGGARNQEQVMYLQFGLIGALIGHFMAKSTLMGILGRMATYTGQKVTWEQALNSKEDLMPATLDWNAPPPPAVVALPGITKVV